MIPKGQALFEWLRPQLHGWEPALLSTGPGYARIQLQSEPPESEECGTIRCITESNLKKCIAACIKFSEENKLK